MLKSIYYSSVHPKSIIHFYLQMNFFQIWLRNIPLSILIKGPACRGLWLYNADVHESGSLPRELGSDKANLQENFGSHKIYKKRIDTNSRGETRESDNVCRCGCRTRCDIYHNYLLLSGFLARYFKERWSKTRHDVCVIPHRRSSPGKPKNFSTKQFFSPFAKLIRHWFIVHDFIRFIQGMIYLHDSEITSHGHLRSTNCVVDSRWILQVSDFGLNEFKAGQERPNHEIRDQIKMLYTAPELLRNPLPYRKGTQKGDVYRFVAWKWNKNRTQNEILHIASSLFLVFHYSVRKYIGRTWIPCRGSFVKNEK